MGKRRKIGEGNERPDLVDAVQGMVNFLATYDPSNQDAEHHEPASSAKTHTNKYQTRNPDTEMLTDPVASALATQSDPALRVFRDVFRATDEDIEGITAIIAEFPELQRVVSEFHAKAGYNGNPPYLSKSQDS